MNKSIKIIGLQSSEFYFREDEVIKTEFNKISANVFDYMQIFAVLWSVCAIDSVTVVILQNRCFIPLKLNCLENSKQSGTYTVARLIFNTVYLCKPA